MRGSVTHSALGTGEKPGARTTVSPCLLFGDARITRKTQQGGRACDSPASIRGPGCLSRVVRTHCGVISSQRWCGFSPHLTGTGIQGPCLLEASPCTAPIRPQGEGQGQGRMGPYGQERRCPTPEERTLASHFHRWTK